MSKLTIISIIATILLIGGSVYLTQKDSVPGGQEIEEGETIDNVSVENGKQIVLIRAKGGYTPRRSEASAGIATILRINTSGTFDCASIVRIPKLDILQNLPLSGTTDIELGIQEKGILQGSCGMGMYPFEIAFN